MSLVAAALSAIAGFAACFAVSAISGRKEAWDSNLYFVAAIPAMCVVIFVIAYVFPMKPWRWALAMAFGQSIAMVAAGNSASLWPLSLVAMTIVSIPQFAVAIAAGAIARKPTPAAPDGK
jgi:hypothetical protein